MKGKDVNVVVVVVVVVLLLLLLTGEFGGRFSYSVDKH